MSALEKHLFCQVAILSTPPPWKQTFQTSQGCIPWSDTCVNFQREMLNPTHFTADVSEQGALEAVDGKLLLSKATIWETKCLQLIQIAALPLSESLRVRCILINVSRRWDELLRNQISPIPQLSSQARRHYITCTIQRRTSPFTSFS